MTVVTNTPGRGTGRSAFTLVEVMVGVIILAVGVASLYLGFSQGFAVIQMARENLRATQILQEKMETIRLFDWSQVTTGPSTTNFTAQFYPLAAAGNQGITYSGTRIITNAPVTESYSNDMRLIIFQLTWTSGNVQRQREMSTMVSQYGLHNYVFWGR
jgi:prepilin-type N-terminal cleavage/methylation domain-containing protein